MKTRAPLQTLLWLVLLQLDQTSPVKSSESQPSSFIKSTFRPVTVGKNVTMDCFYEHNLRPTLYWLKQSLENTQIVVSAYYESPQFYNDFINNHRFSLDNKNDKNNLKITNVQISDSAVYLCVGVTHKIDLLATVHVIVKESTAGLQIEQREVEAVKPGRSVKLDCSVHLGACDGQHRVHWFKQSEESAAGVLYSHGGGSSDQCERNSDAPTNSCVYSLPIHNLSSEQTGTYYCAVAACGQVLLGNGTKVQINGVWLYVLSGVSVFSTSLVIGLTFCLCLKNNTDSSKRMPTPKGFPKFLQYVPSEQVMMSEGRGQSDDTWSECVYFSVEPGK